VVSQLGDPRYHDLSNIVAIWTGGLSIPGAVIGGAVAVIVYCWRSKLSFFKWGDIIAPGLALGQAIGRWGNYFNQEAFGAKTTLPWGIPISVDRQREVAGANDPNFVPDPNARFHPTFAYEMLWDLLNFGILMWLGRQKRIRLLEGDVMWVYLIVYSLGRFVIEAIRVDSATVGDVKTPQLVALLTILLAWTMIIYRHRPGTTARISEINLPDEERARLQKKATARTASRVRRVPALVGADGEPPANVASASRQPASRTPGSAPSET
jgi:phosphatidylglycerol:prolipoprotein diacylglycerol transferase